MYRQREEKLEQLTEDHSPVFRLFKQGVLTKDQMQRHPQKNLLDRVAGCISSTESGRSLGPSDLRRYLFDLHGWVDRRSF